MCQYKLNRISFVLTSIVKPVIASELGDGLETLLESSELEVLYCVSAGGSKVDAVDTALALLASPFLRRWGGIERVVT